MSMRFAVILVSITWSFPSHATNDSTLAGAGALAITTGPILPPGAPNARYEQALGTAGGTPPYLWSVTGGALPPGLGLEAGTGAISGLPTTPGHYTFTATVADSAGGSAQRQLSLTISDSRGVEYRAQRQTAMVETACGEYGAGVVVQETREYIYVLTRDHILAYGKCPQGTAQFYSSAGTSKRIPFKVVHHTGKGKDLAVLKIARSGDPDFRFHFSFNLARSSVALRRGDHLFVIGYPNHVDPWFVPPEPLFFARNIGEKFEIGPATSLQKGMSGGPICNADGEIVALTDDTGGSLSTALPITAAINVVKEWNDPKSKLFAERWFPVIKPHYTEIGAHAMVPTFTGGLSNDGPGVGLYVTHGITRLFAATFDTSMLYAKGSFLDSIETQQILLPSGGLQLQPFANLARQRVHESLGGLYIGGGLGWAFISRSVQGPRVSVKENLSSMMLTTEAGYRVPLPPRGWGLKFAYKVYQPMHSEGVERAASLTVGLYGLIR